MPPHSSAVNFKKMKFWKFYKERLKDDDLKYISYADYGRDFNDHYRALKELVESENVNLLKNWFPLEVIELTRWNPPTEQTVDSISFCAGLLLLGASNKHVSEYISSINENLIIIIDCNELFDEDFQEILLELINILIKSDRKYHEEETPFLYLAKAIVEIYYQLPHHESMGEYCLSVEHHFEHGLCAVNNPKTIYDLTYFNQRNELWKKHIKKANLSNYHISL